MKFLSANLEGELRFTTYRRDILVLKRRVAMLKLQAGGSIFPS